jgi:uncharacterized protein with HEPN domain
MRNILIHQYFEIELDQVWSTVNIDLPKLIVQLREIMPPHEE